jgi:hypothetical protein
MPTRDHLIADLLSRHGELIGQQALAHLLGYETTGALRKAAERGQLPIRLHSVPGRRGRLALTREVADWLADLREQEATM